MARADERRRIRGDLRRSLGDGVFFSLMVGMGETYLPAFVLAVGLGEITAGLVATLPMLAGALLQTATPWAVRRLGSHRRWVVGCAAVQTAAFAPLAAAAVVGRIPAAAVFLIAAVYWGAGLATGPAWNTWISTLVPRRVRAHYFARRTRAAQAAILAGLLGGGALLQLGAGRGQVLRAFALLFLAAGVCRLVSARLLALQSEPDPIPAGFRSVPPLEMLGRFRRGPDGRLLAYMLAVQGAVQIAAPFFTPYMLSQMRLSYGSYTAMVATAYLARVIALPLWGRLAHRRGAAWLAWIGGLGIVPAALPWVLFDSVPVLLATQLAAGAMWAAYELATFLLFFEHIHPAERTSVLTLYNLANGVTIAAGAAAGGWLLGALGAGAGAYTWIFLASTALRGLTPLLLRGVTAPPLAPPSEVVPEALGTGTIAVRPSLGAMDRPILSSLPDPAGTGGSPAEGQDAAG